MDATQALARRFVEALFDPDEDIDDIVAPQVVLHAWPWVSAGLRGLSQARHALSRAWADQVLDIHETLQSDDRVILRVTERGVHAGTWNGVEPTGTAVATGAIHIVRVIDARVVEYWRETDDLARLRQIGA
jgi:predicted ester cyclase